MHPVSMWKTNLCMKLVMCECERVFIGASLSCAGVNMTLVETECVMCRCEHDTGSLNVSYAGVSMTHLQTEIVMCRCEHDTLAD